MRQTVRRIRTSIWTVSIEFRFAHVLDLGLVAYVIERRHEPANHTQYAPTGVHFVAILDSRGIFFALGLCSSGSSIVFSVPFLTLPAMRPAFVVYAC